MADSKKILYCRCAYAKVIPGEVKEAVLQKLCDSEKPFEAVADLCRMSANRDPALKRIAEGPPARIAACFPRAVKWLFSAAGATLPEEGMEVLNMREESAETVCEKLLGQETSDKEPV